MTERTRTFFRAGNGALVVSFSHDDVTGKMTKFSAVLTSGTAYIVLDRGNTLRTQIVSGSRDISVVALDRTLNKGAGISIQWSKT